MHGLPSFNACLLLFNSCVRKVLRKLHEREEHIHVVRITPSKFPSHEGPFRMEGVSHKYVPTNGIDMHIAELGSGPPVVLLHGFPEIWYSWRHQMVALAKAGFRAIAPDFRGYGLSRNTDPSKNHWFDCVDDIVGLLDALHLDKVYVVAKDWGALVAYRLGYAHAGRILGLAVLGIPYFRPSGGAAVSRLPDGHYLSRWSIPGVPEADFGRFDVATVIRRIYILFCNSQMPLASDSENTLDLVKASDPLPDWMTEQDLHVYAGLYEKSGFAYPMEVPYKCLGRIPPELLDGQDLRIPAPLLIVIGDRDYVVEIMPEAGIDRSLTPKLEVVHIEEGSHFVQEQFPTQINELLVRFFTSEQSA